MAIRILSIDPGAERCGWAVLDVDDHGVSAHVDSGILQFRREGMVFQEYRVKLEEASWFRFDSLLTEYAPSVVVNEIIPSVSSSSNFVLAGQSYLANTVVSVLHVCAVFHSIPVAQISAREVQSKIVLEKRKDQKISKQQVRNGVLHSLPEIAHKKSEWIKSKHWDESDALAIGLVFGRSLK